MFPAGGMHTPPVGVDAREPLPRPKGQEPHVVEARIGPGVVVDRVVVRVEQAHVGRERLEIHLTRVDRDVVVDPPCEVVERRRPAVLTARHGIVSLPESRQRPGTPASSVNDAHSV